MNSTIVWKTFPLALAAIVLMSTGCSKYDDGPGVSLVPRTERVANTWVIDRATADGENVTADYNQYVLGLTTDNAATLEAEYTVFGIDVSTETTGTWAFASDQEQLVLDFEEDLADGTYIINRLTQSELWLRKVGEDLELRLREQ
ncbi:MAG: hypothetical protein WEC15_06995 [Flavobacteriales bacterium]